MSVWRLIGEFFASVGYGVLSSFVPVFNSEVYIVAVQALGPTLQVTAALGVATGQVVGKTAIVVALRNGTKIPLLARQVDKLRARAEAPTRGRTTGRVRRRLQRWSQRLLHVLGQSRWGGLIVFMSGATGLPPIFAVQFLVPATKMRIWVFALALFLGRCVLFLAVAFGASAVIERLFS